MASIIKKIKKGRPYYYAAESARVNGKPRIVWQKYLGTLEAIVKRADGITPPKPKEAVIFEAGGVAALLGIAQHLGLVEIINAVTPKRNQGPSVGHYMVLAAINRALSPCSKLAIGDWYEQTVLRRLWRFRKKEFSSQRFWDHMDMVSEEVIDVVQDKLVRPIQQTFGLDGKVLLYDTTNFFTFLATTNDRCEVAQRGHSKAKRHDLRQVGLALLVTRTFQVPLFHRTYPGNVPDVSLFPKLAKELIVRHHRASKSSEAATPVFDKGNVSDNAMERLVVSGSHFVAALGANRASKLLAIPLDEFQPIPEYPGTRTATTETTIWSKDCRVVVVYTESFFTQQLSGVTHNLVKCQKKLMDLEKSLRRRRQGKARGKRPTLAQVRRSVRGILAPQFMKDLFSITIAEERGLPSLRYALDHEALDRLSHERLGRTVLITDHLDWTPKEIIAAYRSLTAIEETFKNMKSVDFLRWQPAFHWTEQKVKVHAFYWVLALLLATLARKVVVQAGIDLSLPALLKELTAIREVAVLYPPGTLAHRKDHIALSRMTPRQKKIAECLKIADILGR